MLLYTEYLFYYNDFKRTVQHIYMFYLITLSSRIATTEHDYTDDLT